MRSTEGTLAAGLHLVPSPRTKSSVFLVIVALVTLGAAGLTFRRATTPWASMPDSDYWGNIAGLITEGGVKFDLPALFHHNNEHIVLIPKLIYAANYLATSGSNTGLIIYSLLAGAACTGLLLFLARGLLIDSPWRLLLCALLFPLVMFSAKLTHSYFLGMSGAIWLTADLLVIGSAAALARAISTESAGWLVLALALALLGILTYSTAVYALLVLLLFCVAKLWRPSLPGPSAWPLLVGTAIVIVVMLGLGIAYRNLPQHKPDFEFNPLRLAEFVLIYLGNALTTGPSRLVVGLVILIAGAVSIRRLFTEGRIKETLFWVVLFLFAPFNALTTGIGRAGYGVKIAATSRYQSVAAITLIATLTLVLAALPKHAHSRRAAIWRNLAFAALFLCAALLAFDRSYVTNYTARNQRKAIAEIALRQGIEGNHHLKAATPAPVQLDRILPVLRAARHAPFHWRSRCEDMLGEHIAEPSAPAMGQLESVSVYKMAHGAGRALKVSGWATRDGAGPECIAIVDGTRMVIGSGAAVAQRLDVERDKGRSLGLVGWEAVAALPQTAPVCAFALFRGEIQLAPLSRCAGLDPEASAPGAKPAQAPLEPPALPDAD